MSTVSSNSAVRWNPKNLEIRTLAVEKTLEPLVIQVTTLVNGKGPSNKKKGKSKKPKALVESVENATACFVAKGTEIAKENPEMRNEIEKAVEETESGGDVMAKTAHAFADDPCSSMKRGSMVRAARSLLSSVTKLLILADMADVYRLLNQLKLVKRSAIRVRDAANSDDLDKCYQLFNKDIAQLNQASLARQNDLKDPRRRDELAAARGELKTNGQLLYSSTLASIEHPQVAAAKANRDYIYKRVVGAMDRISAAVQASGSSDARPEETVGELANALDVFLDRVNMDPLNFDEVRHRPSLEERLESIISGAALMADSSCTREVRRERIVAECNAVRQALQDLLQEYMNSLALGKPTNDLEEAIDSMKDKTKDLRRQLCKAVIDHVSDSFLNRAAPIIALIEAAKSGDENLVKEEAQVFRDHANKLVEVANLACSMSNNEEGVKMVKLAARQIEVLCPQVINAALTLAARPNSQVARHNIETYKHAWLKQVGLLTDAVDEVTSIDKFLAVSEAHILEDVTDCVQALQEGEPDHLAHKGADILGRAARICQVVKNEIENYEPDFYTEKVSDACDVLSQDTSKKFQQQLEASVNALNNGQDPHDNDFIDCSRMVYDAVRDIRRAVLTLKNPEDIDSDSDVEEIMNPSEAGMSIVSSTVDTDTAPNDQQIMRKLPEAEKEKIQVQVKEFVEEKRALDLEISKWDESSNDIIVLARSMCLIMMDMTDFTRGRGKLKNTTDVIDAARRIAETGTRLDEIAKHIANACPDSTVKNDLLAYLQRISLYCHQLNMCSKVMLEINISGGTAGLDGAMSLIQAAKNLMNAVVQTVKTSYVASTKYLKSGQATHEGILWKMKAPEKKPLVRHEKRDGDKPIRRASQKRREAPEKVLSDFKADL